jgi:hypothetical protein
VYIDETYLQEALGSAKVAALCPTPGELARVIEQAHAETQSALMIGGYSAAVPHTVYANVAACPSEIRLAAYGAWLELAYGRVDLALPDAFRAYVGKLEELKRGDLEIQGVSKTVSRAVGGVSFTDSSETANVSEGARPQVFNRKTLLGF